MHDINEALGRSVSFAIFLAKHPHLSFNFAFSPPECECLLSLLVIRLTKGKSRWIYFHPKVYCYSTVVPFLHMKGHDSRYYYIVRHTAYWDQGNSFFRKNFSKSSCLKYSIACIFLNICWIYSYFLIKLIASRFEILPSYFLKNKTKTSPQLLGYINETGPWVTFPWETHYNISIWL